MDNRVDLHELRTCMKFTKPEMAAKMGISLRGYEELEAGRTKVKILHLYAAYFAALEFVNSSGNADNLPRHLREFVTGVARLVAEAKARNAYER